MKKLLIVFSATLITITSSYAADWYKNGLCVGAATAGIALMKEQDPSIAKSLQDNAVGLMRAAKSNGSEAEKLLNEGRKDQANKYKKLFNSGVSGMDIAKTIDRDLSVLCR